MALLHLHLQDGFHEDDVRIIVQGTELYRREDVTTRVQTGLADTCETTVEDDEGEVDIHVEVLSRDVAATISVNVTGKTYLGVSLTRDGEITHRVSREPFRYM